MSGSGGDYSKDIDKKIKELDTKYNEINQERKDKLKADVRDILKV